MELCPVVVSPPGELGKVPAGHWGVVPVELNDNVAHSGKDKEIELSDLQRESGKGSVNHANPIFSTFDWTKTNSFGFHDVCPFPGFERVRKKIAPSAPNVSSSKVRK